MEAHPARPVRHRDHPLRCSSAWVLAAGVVQVTGNTTHLLDRVPTAVDLPARARPAGRGAGSGTVALILVGGFLVAVVLGAFPAHLAARRMPRDEARMETDQHEPRPMPRQRARDPGPHRPRVRLALGADAARRPGPRRRPRPGRRVRRPEVDADVDPAGPGRLGWCPAVRRQRLVPRRPRRPVAGEPAGPTHGAVRRATLGARRVPRRRLPASPWPSAPYGQACRDGAGARRAGRDAARRHPPGRRRLAPVVA